MQKITSKVAALRPGSNYFSLEFFPPKTSVGASNLRTRLDRMSRALRPLFVTVTWGAGGSTASHSLELAELCQRELGLTTCLHLTCTNMSIELIDQTLDKAQKLGIRNILALRGDPPCQEYKSTTLEEKHAIKLIWAVDLVRYIRKKYGDYFCIGVAAYPEGHPDRENPDEQSLEHDIPYLVEKVKAGADFIITQLLFDADAYDMFEKRLREHESGCFNNMPIIPGLMPIQSYQIVKRTVKLTHVRIPPKIAERLDSIKGDDELVKKDGIDIINELVTHIKHSQLPSIGRRGFHFFTLNLEKAVSCILERTSLIPHSPVDLIGSECAAKGLLLPPSLALCANSSPAHPPNYSNPATSDLSKFTLTPTFNQSHPRNQVASDICSALEPSKYHNNTLAISEGEGIMGREANWDDFPNGRWGDARSPAYGEIGGYGASSHMFTKEAIRLWGYPISIEDITSLFIGHIEGSLSTLPWSEEGLNKEIDIIRDKLIKLNRKGWWTIASQPAINGVRSCDDVYGWGPRNGFVFQKAFIEFFLSSEAWKSLREKLRAKVVEEDITWYAYNSKGEFQTSANDLAIKSKCENSVGKTNAVTWGVFPGKEIICPTIIEEVSFCAWAEEAFDIWAEWGRVYNSNSSLDSNQTQLCQKLIEGLRVDVWLVNIIHHDYIKNDALWEFLAT